MRPSASTLRTKQRPVLSVQPSVSNAMAVLVSAQGWKRQARHECRKTRRLAGRQADRASRIRTKSRSTTWETSITTCKSRRARTGRRFVLTYTPSPTLTVYVKSDPNAGTAIVMTGQDDVEVFINNLSYRRKTDRGQVRVPLKVGEYTIRVHKSGFIDPPPQTIDCEEERKSRRWNSS